MIVWGANRLEHRQLRRAEDLQHIAGRIDADAKEKGSGVAEAAKLSSGKNSHS